MGDLLYETISPMAWNDEGEPFEFPPATIALRVRKYLNRPGRPRTVWGPKGPLHVGVETTMEQFRKAVNNELGSYRLYPVDKNGNELGPVAVIELVPDGPAESGNANGQALAAPEGADVGSGRTGADIPHRFFDLYDRMLSSRDANDELMSRLLTTLVTTTATIQQSTAALLDAANTTVKVANGVEALERVEAPQLDIEGLTDRLAVVGQLKETLAALGEPDGKSDAPWFVQLLNGPVGAGMMGLVSSFAKTIVEAQARPAGGQRGDGEHDE